jgi:hypothetical protein
LFINKTDLWCQAILYYSDKILSYLQYIDIDENFLIAIGYLLNEYSEGPIKNKIFNWNIRKSKKYEHRFYIKINNDLTININIDDILRLLNDKYSDEVITACIQSLPKYVSQAEKPYTYLEDFCFNSEEFFWGPFMYIHEDWFKKEYPNIHNILCKDIKIIR